MADSNCSELLCENLRFKRKKRFYEKNLLGSKNTENTIFMGHFQTVVEYIATVCLMEFHSE